MLLLLPSFQEELGALITGKEGTPPDAEDGPVRLTEREETMLLGLTDHLERMQENENAWIPLLEATLSQMESNNFLEKMEFIPADHDYTGLMDDEMLEYVREQGGNEKHGMYLFLAEGLKCLKTQCDIMRMESLHEDASKTQLPVAAPDETAKIAEPLPPSGDGGSEARPAGQAAS